MLKLRVGDNKVETVFVNFPEPVQQQCNDIDDDENGHMLMKSNLKIIGACLLGNGKGRFVMVSDNLSYTRLIARLLTSLMCGGNTCRMNDGGEGVNVNQGSGLRRKELVRGRESQTVSIFCGMPNASVGWVGGGGGISITVSKEILLPP